MNKYIFVGILVVVIVLVSTAGKTSLIAYGNPEVESFGTQNWGHKDEYNMPWKPEIQNRNIVGPDTDVDVVNPWQYHPQNSLTDYKYYQENRDLTYSSCRNNLNVNLSDNRKTQQLAPIAHGEIGTVTSPTYQQVYQPDQPQSTRVANEYSTPHNMVIPNATSAPELTGPHVQYEW